MFSKILNDHLKNFEDKMFPRRLKALGHLPCKAVKFSKAGEAFIVFPNCSVFRRRYGEVLQPETPNHSLHKKKKTKK